GGMAAILPLWLQTSGFTIDRVITVGQPKVTDGALAGRLALLHVTRLIAADDLVPGFPRSPEYSHFGRAVELLDGPYIVSLVPGDPGYDNPANLPDNLPDFMPVDHGTYDIRLATKLHRTVYQLRLDSIGAQSDNP